ncbi:MAG: glycosyltransferase [Phycisphaerae bacterium]
MPVKICQLITELVPAGAERSVFELSRRLDAARFDVQVAALRGGPVADWLSQAGIPVHVMDVRGKWDVLKLSKLAAVLREGRFDILHTHLFHADLAGRPAARIAGVPHVINTVHTAEGRFRPWQFAYARLMGEQCDRIVCVSNDVREFHQQRTHLPDRQYTVIPNGTDVEAFAHDVEARRRLRRQWGVDEQTFLLAFLGRLDPVKGLDTLLGALSHLGARGCPARIVVAGDGPQRKIIENYIAHGEGGKLCTLLGYVQDVASLLSAVDCLALPSRWEGQSLAALEGMAAALPVICTRVPGLAEVVVDNETGLCVPVDDPVALAEAIDTLRADRDRARQLGQAGRKRVCSEYHVGQFIRAHEALYEEVAASPRAG